MAKSNLLKEAIADAKAVRETAIANAKIALEEAFTPRLQSILSQKLQQEIDGEEDFEDDGMTEEYGKEDAPTGDSTSIGAGAGTGSGTNNKQPSGITTHPHTELDPETGKETSAVGSELDDVTVVREGEGTDEDGDGVIDDPTGATVTESDDFDADDANGDFDNGEEDELDLESIIRELEGELDGEEDEFGSEEEVPSDDFAGAEEAPVEDEFGGEEIPTDEAEQFSNGEDAMGNEPVEDEFGGAPEDDDIDLDEILREMGYGDDEDESASEAPADEQPWNDEKEGELEEAYSVIKSLKGTINEVNLLNAKLLYSNKLFRSYELTTEQKMKVVETLDRTVNVREVKLVFATLAESLKLGNTTKKRKSKITESFSSNVVPSTAPKKEIINESNDMAARFKQLANIKNK
jgi:hypothetical protein